MDTSVSELLALDQRAKAKADTLSSEKAKLRDQYEQKKTAYQTQAQTNFDAKLDSLKAQDQAEAEKREKAMSASYNEQLQTIESVLNSHLDDYLTDFKEDLKQLGVHEEV